MPESDAPGALPVGQSDATPQGVNSKEVALDDYQNLANSVPHLVWVMDAQGNALYYNRGWIDYTGITLGKPSTWDDLLHPADVEVARRAWEECIQSGHGYQVEYRLKGTDGLYRWFLVRAVSARDAQGVLKWFGTCTDIDETKKSTQALLRTREQVSSVQAEARELEMLIATQQQIATSNLEPAALIELVVQRAIELTHADGGAMSVAEGDDLVVQVVGGQTAMKPGFKVSLHRSVGGLCIRENRAILSNYSSSDPHTNPNVKQLLSPGSVIGAPLWRSTQPVGTLTVWCDATHHFDDTNLRAVELIASLLSAALEQAAAIKSRDEAIASFKESERKLQLAKRDAEIAANAKADFLATMSHEIRTPLNGVIGLTDILLETALTPKQAEYLRVVQTSGHNLLTILNDILDFSKIEAGKMEMESIALDVTQIIQTQAMLLATRALEKGIVLNTFIEPHLDGRLLGDPTRIGQVVLNFLSNAIKFTAAGKVDLRAVSETVQGATVLHISITDTGIGMSAEAQERLFKPFSQAERQTARQFGGTGLGLSIAKRLVDMMQGQLGVSSVMGVGSAFWFRVPAPLAPTQQREAAPQVLKKTTAEGVGRVLVCDDNAINQLVASQMLRTLGYESDVVDNGAAAVQSLASKTYSLVLMDCQMPEMDGFEATRRIRDAEQAVGTRIPIVALTADAMAESQSRCERAGMDDFITKPLKKAHLEQVLTRWIR